VTPAAHNIRDFWHHRGLDEQIIQHHGEARGDGFREHPVWLSTIPLLLRNPANGHPPRRVADMGCGTGIMAEHLARLGDIVIAIDFAESRAAVARQRLATYPNIKVRVGDANAPPLEAGEVDAVISRNLLWLLPDPVSTVERWRDLVAPGGRIAAIDATYRQDRSWALALQNFARRNPASRPLANASPGAAAAIWRHSGLNSVKEDDMSWITHVRAQAGPPWKRMLARSRYFAVIGDTPP
jgi:SAM-dependent methyltransferase